MSEESAHEMVAAPNPHAEIEAVATAAIMLPVRVAGFDGRMYTLVAPWHTTEDGLKAIIRTCAKATEGTSLTFFAVLDYPPTVA